MAWNKVRRYEQAGTCERKSQIHVNNWEESSDNLSFSKDSDNESFYEFLGEIERLCPGRIDE